jgi:hypothetical protein
MLSHKEPVKWPLVDARNSGVHAHAGAGGPDLGASSLRKAGACLHLPRFNTMDLFATIGENSVLGLMTVLLLMALWGGAIVLVDRWVWSDRDHRKRP